MRLRAADQTQPLVKTYHLQDSSLPLPALNTLEPVPPLVGYFLYPFEDAPRPVNFDFEQAEYRGNLVYRGFSEAFSQFHRRRSNWNEWQSYRYRSGIVRLRELGWVFWQNDSEDPKRYGGMGLPALRCHSSSSRSPWCVIFRGEFTPLYFTPLTGAVLELELHVSVGIGRSTSTLNTW